MDDTRWTDVDCFITDTLLPKDPAFEEALRAEEEGGLPPINVSAPQGMLLHVLARAIGARRVLEIGTLAGYSTIWLARAVGGQGRVITLEIDPHHAEIARGNFAQAGVDGIVDVRVGPALESLASIEKEGGAPFDLVFIDADKATYPDYVSWALRLSRPGTLIIIDNVVREGKILEPSPSDPNVVGTRRALELLGEAPQVVATALQTVGTKGYDGLAVALVTGEHP
jgi:predicted O-methyltransferase YrrM